MKRKIYLILGILLVSILTVLGVRYLEDWSSSITAKNFETVDFGDGLIDICETPIRSESNSFKGSTRLLISEENDDEYHGSAEYSCKIQIEGGEIKYRLTDFKTEWSQIREDDTIYEGTATMEYTVTYKKTIPVEVEFTFDNWNEEHEIEMEGEEFFYTSLGEGRVVMKNKCSGSGC